MGSKIVAVQRIPTERIMGDIRGRQARLFHSGSCAGTFDDHERVSESTIVEQEKEVLSMDMDYEIYFLCVVQWSMHFSRPRG